MIVATKCFPSLCSPSHLLKNGRNVAMQPRRYATEHLNMAIPVGLFAALQKSLTATLVFSAAELKIPICESCRCNGSIWSSSMELPRAGPSKFAERSVICRRTRSPVPGKIKVPFRSFYIRSHVNSVEDDFLWCEESYTFRSG